MDQEFPFARNNNQNNPVDIVQRIGWRHRPRRRMVYVPAQRERAWRLRCRGYSYRQIAERVGNGRWNRGGVNERQILSAGTVYEWCRSARNQARAQGLITRW